MKQTKYQRMPGKMNNKGFSLVELLISIVVLVIIIVPLMGSFFRSMQMNKKAEDIQVQSNLAASIMEGLKADSITEIIEKFNVTNTNLANFDIISDNIEDVMRLEYSGPNLIETNSNIEQSTYHFAIHGIQVGSTAYDALITMDSTAYEKADLSKTNDYLMPEVTNLDQKVTGILFSDGTKSGTDPMNTMDDIALDNYVLWGSVYARTVLEQSAEYQAYLEAYDSWQDAKVKEETDGDSEVFNIPEPTEPTLDSFAESGHTELYDYFRPSNIMNFVYKTMNITVQDKVINYEIEYHCNWPAKPVGSTWPEVNIESTIRNQITNAQLLRTVQNVYVLYTPSKFQDAHQADTVAIRNDASDNPINLFIAKQDGTNVINKITIRRNGGNLSAFTNITAFDSYVEGEKEAVPTTVNSQVVKTKQEDRIFDVTIQICKYAGGAGVLPADRYQVVEYTLESSKEK